MKILIAEDDPISRRLLEATLRKWGYDLVVVGNGEEAWTALQETDAPRLALLDWMMPGIDGVEICRRVRATPNLESCYLILVTAKTAKEDMLEGLETGADEYVTKPFDRAELKARITTGLRILDLQLRLAERVRELEDSLAHVKQLSGLLPICCYCKSIRDDKNYWQKVESYITDRSDAQFSHGVCPECLVRVMASMKKELDA